MGAQPVAAEREKPHPMKHVTALGPRTTAGKQIARRNAVVHGLRAGEVLLATEKACDLADLDRRLREDLKPVGELEHALLDQIVASLWRLRRAHRAEAAALDLAAARVRGLVPDPNVALGALQMHGAGLRAEIRHHEAAIAWLADGDPLAEPEDEDDGAEGDPVDAALVTLAEHECGDVLTDEDGPTRVRQHLRALGWSVERTRAAVLPS